MLTNHTNWPKTLDETVDQILSWLPEEDQILLKKTSQDALVKFYYDLGPIIRNKFSLWHGNKDFLRSCGLESIHPDDASMIIIRAV